MERLLTGLWNFRRHGVGKNDKAIVLTGFIQLAFAMILNKDS